MERLSREKGEHAIALVLRTSSLASAVVMALGLLLMLARGPGYAREGFHRIRFDWLFSSLLQLEPAALAECGILLLLFTPIFRLIAAATAFALERDMKFVLISLAVLAIVFLSISFAIET